MGLRASRERRFVRTCANGVPSARIVDCARMKSASVHNRRSWIKGKPVPLLLLSVTVISVRMRFSSVQKLRLARVSAQVRSWHATLIEAYLPAPRSRPACRCGKIAAFALRRRSATRA